MHLFLSPHFDDAVLSCGGLIHQLVSGGKRVVIRTVMGGKPSPKTSPDTPITRDLHARWSAGADPVGVRIEEDERAVASLGAVADRLVNWTDCVYRVSRSSGALYATEESLWGEIHPEDVAGNLLPTLVLPPREVVHAIYAPLAVGHHIDHQIVRNWALELRKQYPWVALKFYEEYPYLEQPNVVDRAIQFFATCQPPLKLGAEVVLLDEADMSAKVAAIAHYATQISTFWTDTAALNAAVQASLNRVGGGQPAERLWHIF
jgi:LmbE family N-acetylglucosaminyl deacetylase